MTQENKDIPESKWLKILGGSFLVAVGFFFLFEAFNSIEIWKEYQRFQKELQQYEQELQQYKAGYVFPSRPDRYYYDKNRIQRYIPDELLFLDNVPALVILGIPMLIIGSALCLKGIKEYLR